jgi:hypothetical protein
VLKAFKKETAKSDCWTFWHFFSSLLKKSKASMNYCTFLVVISPRLKNS